MLSEVSRYRYTGTQEEGIYPLLYVGGEIKGFITYIRASPADRSSHLTSFATQGAEGKNRPISFQRDKETTSPCQRSNMAL